MDVFADRILTPETSGRAGLVNEGFGGVKSAKVAVTLQVCTSTQGREEKACCFTLEGTRQGPTGLELGRFPLAGQPQPRPLLRRTLPPIQESKERFRTVHAMLFASMCTAIQPQFMSLPSRYSFVPTWYLLTEPWFAYHPKPKNSVMKVLRRREPLPPLPPLAAPCRPP